MELPEHILKQAVQRGSILLSDSFEDIDHAKFFAVMGIHKGKVAGFFFINSRIHPILEAKPEQLAMQYLLKKCDYAFLRYDSFLSANELLKRSVGEIVGSIRNKHTSIVGHLTESDLLAILEACRHSNLFSAREKEQFFS